MSQGLWTDPTPAAAPVLIYGERWGDLGALQSEVRYYVGGLAPQELFVAVQCSGPLCTFFLAYVADHGESNYDSIVYEFHRSRI